ncbi:hypothetical protein EDC04DRAFT_2535539, partial [Pisolithus marmoratus]
KGKGANPKNWGALDTSDDELSIDAQQAAFESWNTAHRLANGSESDEPGPSGRGTLGNEPPTERDKHTNPKMECMKRHKKRNGSRQRNKRASKAVEPSKAPQNPVKALVEKVTRQDHKHRDHQRTLHAMEPIKQINPKSYIGLT